IARARSASIRPGAISARRSNALSMTLSRLLVATNLLHNSQGAPSGQPLESRAIRRHASRGFHANLASSAQGDPHEATPRIDVVTLPRQIPARQHRPVRRLEQSARERLVVITDVRPEVKAPFGGRHAEGPFEYRHDGLELCPILVAIGDHVLLIGPRRDAGLLDGRSHGASMIRAIAQKRPE